jgi:hypothetical protein
MRLSRHLLACLSCLLVLPLTTATRAEAPPDPLRLMPDQADLLVQVHQPRQLIEAFTTLEQLKQLQKFEAIRELYDSTNYHRFFQLVAYFEKQLGHPWPELLDRLAGGGALLGIKFAPDPAPALFIIQSKDEALLRKFAKLGLEVVEQELARKESKDRIEKGTYRDVETVRIGKEFHAAVAGSALLISNVDYGLKHAIDLYRDGDAKSLARSAKVAEARKVLPPGPLASLWVNLEPAHENPQLKPLFEQPNNQPALTVLFGGWLDVARRSPSLCAGFYRDPDGFLTTVRLPRGREGMPGELAAHVPPADSTGVLPLLEPKGVLYSSSYFLDVSKLWEHRAKLLNPKQLKDLEEFNKNSGRFLAGTRLSELLTQAGARQRIVVVNQHKPGYKKTPEQRFPAFAFVVEMREPEAFAKSMDPIMRGIGFLASTQVQLKLVEEKHGDYTIVGYRFPEDGEFKADVNDVRFNFSPCYVVVGDQFIACSTLELCHELIDLVQKEDRSGKKGGATAARSRLYSAGGADALQVNEDQLIAQTILGQALAPDRAREEVRAFIDWVRDLGAVQTESGYGAHDFRYDLRIKLGK